MLSLGRAIGSPFFTLYEKEENENMNYGNSYNSNPNANPYLSNNIYQTPYSSASPYNNNNTLGTQFSPQNNTQQMTNQVDTMNYVSKEDYDKLLNEKRKLQEQLENEMAQRVDIEFFKKEQEIMRLPEGQRLIQELDYQKNGCGCREYVIEVMQRDLHCHLFSFSLPRRSEWKRLRHTLFFSCSL